ncbi:hypothetical protein [Eleftheria terrae]|uniref:hypothetical protein n=1 Tax=Eleftheria terrae TaxID=1597781 RepID=UPI00263B46AC|nr:hypothetical protein [Eleftheria terrae]WKB55969.1 hypothetical protein N7L95_28265 [Eleftheria terrae]
MHQHSGPATREELAELHRLTVAALVSRIKGSSRPSLEILQVAGRLLANESTHLGPLSPRRQRELQQLHGLFLDAVLSQMQKEGPKSVGLLLLARSVARDAPDTNTSPYSGATVVPVGDLSLPFNSTEQ